MPQTEYAIQLEHVTKTFGPVIANHDVTMNIRRGEILSLLGENGSGKTTLICQFSLWDQATGSASSVMPSMRREKYGALRRVDSEK